MSTDLFELAHASDLFEEAQAAFAEYCREPSSRLLLFVLFSLNHLREWIAEASYKELEKKRKNGSALLPNEEFYLEIEQLEEFRTIRELCNRSKHHSVKFGGGCTSVTHGLTVDGNCNDSLGQVYYRIDGVDSRRVFLPVFLAYYQWFAAHQVAGATR